MQGVCILLIGTGTLAGIIQMSNLQNSTITVLEVLSVPQFLLAPISGMLMSLATASSTFKEAIISSEFSALNGASIVNAGSSAFEQLPHGSLFHISAKSVNMGIKERFTLLPYEIMVGFSMTVVSTLINIMFFK